MTGLDLARELALLGAECTENLASERVADAHRGWTNKQERWEEVGQRMGAHLAIPDAYQESLCASLGLTPISYWLVMLCGAVEIFPDAARAMTVISGDQRMRLVTPTTFARLMRSAQGLAFSKVLGDAIANTSVERLGLIKRLTVSDDRPLTQQPMRLTLNALKTLLGSGPDTRQTPHLMVHREEPASGTGLQVSFVSSALRLLDDRGILCVRCSSRRAGRQLVLDLAALSEENALLVTATDDLPLPAQLGRLRGALPALDLYTWCNTHPFPEGYIRSVAELLPQLIVIVSQNETTSDLPTVEVDNLTWNDSKRIWSLVLEDSKSAETLARGYRINLEEVRSAARAARDLSRSRARSGEAVTDVESISAQVLAQGARRMERWATRLTTDTALHELIVTKQLGQQLDDVVNWYNTAAIVHDDWGLPRHSTAGQGLSCLFSGPVGTGKTLAAQGLARTLRLNLYQVDLRSLLVEEEGEPEGVLEQLFEEAEAGHGVLLFDNADILLQRQSDGHDLYGYVLQCMDAYSGVSILTTTMRQNIDADMLRRFHFVLDFPMPGRTERRKIWEHSLPPSAHLAGTIDLEPFVERFHLTGGSIHSIGLAAAHFAASAQDGKMRPDHLVKATYRELQKAGLPHSREDFGVLARFLDDSVAGD